MNAVSRAIVVENKWRAQRYGVHGTFVNIGGDGATGVAEMLDQLIDEITPDAESLGCLPEVKHCRAIVDAGTSADAQLAVFKDKEASDAPPDVALARGHRLDRAGDAAITFTTAPLPPPATPSAPRARAHARRPRRARAAIKA